MPIDLHPDTVVSDFFTPPLRHLYTLIRSPHKQFHLSQPLSICQVLQTRNCLCGSLLNYLPYVHVSYNEESSAGPGMPDVSLQCWVDGKDHFLHPTDEGSPRAALDAVGCLCCRCLLLAHVQFGVHKDPKGLFCKAAFQPVSPQPVPVPGALSPGKNS